jgi:Ran GTPase-activating protein 1
MFSTRLRTEIPEALHHLLPAIQNHPDLHTVNLSDNAFGSTAQVPLIDFLSAHLPLEHLILANNGLGPEAGANVAGALATLGEAKAGKKAPALKTVICGRNRLGDSSMLSWAKCFGKNPALETIRMPQNSIRPENVVILLREGIVHCHALKVLDLQDNTFTYRGSLTLADILPQLPELVDLGIGDCLLSSKGGIAIAKALAEGKNEKLEFLRLQYNELTWTVVAEFIKTLKFNLPALKRIELNGNKFEEDEEVVSDLRDVFRGRGSGEVDELDDMEEPDTEEESEEEEEEIKQEEALRSARDVSPRANLTD